MLFVMKETKGIRIQLSRFHRQMGLCHFVFNPVNKVLVYNDIVAALS